MAWARAAEQHTEGAASLEQVQVHPFAGCVVWPIATVVALAHLVAAVAGRNGYWFDEVYMLAIGRDHLTSVPPISRRSRRCWRRCRMSSRRGRWWSCGCRPLRQRWRVSFSPH